MIRRRLFALAAAISLVLCLVSAYCATGNYAMWVHGYVTSETSPVFHDQANLEASRCWERIAILCAVVPILWLSVHVWTRVRRGITQRLEQARLSAGRCIGCGYDLRSSKERCPECGTPVQKGRAS